MKGTRSASAWLIAGCPVLLGLPAVAFAQSGQTGVGNRSGSDIIVYGKKPNAVLAGMAAESELDENGIASYGFDTVGELLGEVVLRFNATDDQPVILINGAPASGLNEISDLPTEVVSRIQVLPRGAAAALGERPTRRVVNIVIKPDHRQITLLGAGEKATAGGAFAGETEVNLLKLSGGNRRSLVLRAKLADPLPESERDIARNPDAVAYDAIGNVLPYPASTAQIDPALSALAGFPVLVAAVPPSGGYTLTNFAAGANRPNITDTGSFRTLAPRRRVFSANANATQIFGRTTVSLNATAEHSESDALSGLPGALLLVPATSPFSPFTTDVALARYFGDALAQSQESDSLVIATIVNAQRGRWRLSLNSNLTLRDTRTDSQLGHDLTSVQGAVTAGVLDPFGPYPADLLGNIRRQASRSRSTIISNTLMANGSPFSLPSGPVNVAARLEWRSNHSRSSTSGTDIDSTSRFDRDEASARLGLVIPLLGSAGSSPIGGVGLELSGALRSVTDAKTLKEYGSGLTWQPIPEISLRASVNREDIAPPPNVLSDAVVVTEGVRIYDFIHGESAVVSYVTGGNRDVAIETRRTTSLSALAMPFASSNLSINAEYLAVKSSNAFAALPPVNAEVQAAFPDRFQRDATGRLVRVDARIVGVSQVRHEQLRWGFTYTETFGLTEGKTPGADPDLAPGTRVNLYAIHGWALSSTRLLRPGLPVVDLLDGAAIGYGGGVPRHTVEFGSAVYRHGFGAQLDGNWTDETRIASGTAAAPSQLRFLPRARLDLKMFANLGPQLPDSPLAKGARISLEISNVFNSRQRVVDENGATPFSYQPYLIDPIGRSVKLSLRKVF